MSEVIDAHECF